MKKIIYFLVLSLFIFNCSKSDDDNSSDSCDTFLECNDGSKWIIDYEGYGVMLLRIKDNINTPFEQWVTVVGEDCYYRFGFDDTGGFTITENTKDKLVIKYDDGSGEIETLTCSIVNGELKIIDDYESIQEVLIFQETTIDVDKLTICP
jgi:hypothetical protein